MKSLLTVVFLFSLASCSLKELADNGFKTKTEITPMAPSKTLAQRFGDGKYLTFNVKIPLTEDSVGYYDIEEVLGNSDLNSNHKSYFQSLLDSWKLKLYNLFVKLGKSNKIKYSSVIKFPQIDSRYIKSAKVKKVFFTTEDCRPEEEDCNTRANFGSNFNLVDTFFLNVSNHNEGDEINSNIIEMDKKTFAKEKKMAFSQTDQSILKSFSEAKENQEQFKAINLVKFYNNIPTLNIDTSKVPEDTDFLHFDVKKNVSFVAKYLKSEKFSHLIKKVEYGRLKKERGSIIRRRIKGVDVYLKEEAKAAEVFKIINGEQSSLAKRMFIFRLDNNYIDAKHYFDSDQFKGVVKDTTMIGKSLFVEIKNEKEMSVFSNLMKRDQNKMDSQVGVYKTERCLRTNCLDLDVKDINLVPLLEKNPNLKIDTYISVKSLGYMDFKYNGFIEVEITIEPPL